MSKRGMAAEYCPQRQSYEKHLFALSGESFVLALDCLHPVFAVCLRHVFHLRAVTGQKDAFATPSGRLCDGVRHKPHLRRGCRESVDEQGADPACRISEIEWPWVRDSAKHFESLSGSWPASSIPNRKIRRAACR